MGGRELGRKRKKKKKDNLNNVKEQDSDDRSEDRSEEDVLRNISVDEDAIKASRKISNTRKTMTIYDNDTIYHNAPKYREETDITDIISSKSKKDKLQNIEEEEENVDVKPTNSQKLKRPNSMMLLSSSKSFNQKKPSPPSTRYDRDLAKSDLLSKKPTKTGTSPDENKKKKSIIQIGRKRNSDIDKEEILKSKIINEVKTPKPVVNDYLIEHHSSEITWTEQNEEKVVTAASMEALSMFLLDPDQDELFVKALLLVHAQFMSSTQLIKKMRSYLTQIINSKDKKQKKVGLDIAIGVVKKNSFKMVGL